MIFCRQSCGQVWFGGLHRQVESKHSSTYRSRIIQATWLPVRGKEGEGWARGCRRVDGGWVRKGGVGLARLCWRGTRYVCVFFEMPPPRRDFALATARKAKKMLFIVKLILHSICVLSYTKVYVKHNIFHKNSQYMIFHVLYCDKRYLPTCLVCVHTLTPRENRERQEEKKAKKHNI